MKVLVCIPCLLTGGTEIQTLSLVKALINAGHSVTIVCYFEYSTQMVERYKAAGAEVRLLSESGSRTQGIKATVSHLWHGLEKTVKEIKPDIAHVQYMAPGALPIIILRALGVKKIIATAHTAGDLYSPRGLKIIHLLNNRILRGFQCITERAERSFFGSSTLLNSDLHSGKHGNHFTIYNNLPSYISLRSDSRSFSTDKPITIGVVSRLEHIKGIDLVIPAFAKVHKKYPNTKLLVVGDGSLRPAMENQAGDNGISTEVEFTGRQPQDALQEHYDRIDILLMPSRSEGFGLTAVEGMARGCVMVAADTGGLPEVIRNGKDGLLHKPESIEDMADKIEYLLSDIDKLRDFSKSAIERANDFSEEKYNRQIALWYNTL